MAKPLPTLTEQHSNAQTKSNLLREYATKVENSYASILELNLKARTLQFELEAEQKRFNHFHNYYKKLCLLHLTK
jgi:hypothetical protein